MVLNSDGRIDWDWFQWTGGHVIPQFGIFPLLPPFFGPMFSGGLPWWGENGFVGWNAGAELTAEQDLSWRLAVGSWCVSPF